ncbi:MAG: TonB-dependent receptor [Bacteroidetes bacterium]|nr:TonB-dependent receptor [Bacteroidota bacterium]
MNFVFPVLKSAGLCLLGAIITLHAAGQQKLIIGVRDAGTNRPIAGVTVSENKKSLGQSDTTGAISLGLSPGTHTLVLTCVGYENKTITATAPGSIDVQLSSAQQELGEVTVVASTRNNQRIENSPMKVEVLGREEVAEESSIKPSGIGSLLGDISGVQIQQSSAVSGNASVRIQGLDGRYTQILRDGMPLYDGFSGGFGVLSIPPLDLRQIELIKGSASTLYGGGAIGGLVNIISRKPTAKQEASLVLNQTTLKESDVNAFVAKKYKHFGYTFFGGYVHQQAVDVNDDGLSDVPRLRSVVVHPRLFFYPGEKTTITAGYTGTFEHRDGGDMQVLGGKSDAVHRYFENNRTGRHSLELMAETSLSGGKKLSLKNSFSSFDRGIGTDSLYVKARQQSWYSELSLYVPYGHNSFVAGVNVVGDRFEKLPSDDIQLNDFSNNTVGAFVQNTWQIKDNLTLEAGLRDDVHNSYGNFFLPRLAVFYRLNEHWATRAGVGLGYKIPNPLAPQLVDYNIENIRSLPAGIKAEKSVGYNAEVNYKKVWNKENEIFINQAFFLTNLSHPVIATEETNGNVDFSNGGRPIVSKGFDTYIKALLAGWEVYAGYTYTIVERKYLSQNQFMPLTPRNRMAFTLVRDWEEEGWRSGLEGSWTGGQYRLDDSRTPGYFFMAAMAAKQIGPHVNVVLNVENLLDFRQSRKEALYTGTITRPVFQPLWAPIDGRVFNLALKLSL